MRLLPTYPEQRLWDALKSDASGVHFRRQHPIGDFIVDFCAPRYRLIVEVDGSIHDGEPVKFRDEQRDKILVDNGYRVLHFSAREVLKDIDEVVSRIRESL